MLQVHQVKPLFTDISTLDLPRDLTLIDIETSLPKLSVLAPGGSSEEVFSLRSSLDALFRPFDPKDNISVDVMVVGTKEGNIHISIYDSFVIGSFISPVALGGVPLQLIHHASQPQCSTHSLLMRRSNSEEGSLYFVPMDLRFVSASSEYLSLLASRSTTLQNLLRYIHQVQLLMHGEWIATQELPAKFLRNINETLEENGNKNIVQALYHSVATGHTFPVVREWLVDELTERASVQLWP
jgi:anaphase-promoting complex subunit 4